MQLLPNKTTMPDGQLLTDEQYARLMCEEELYFEVCLQIRTKDQGLQPLKLNASQRVAHEAIEKQRAETGKVRALILKGRQQGISTYVGARFYRAVSTATGQLAFIITHEDQATQNLFAMTKRYHENNLPDTKPQTSTANTNELRFPKLDSGFKVATAGARTAGRSSTIQYLHASEFDFWPDHTADEVWNGLTEAVPNAAGTEIIVESTANKPGGRFHRAWRAAKRGDTAFIAIFIPWFVHDEYRTPAPRGWRPPEEFEIYMRLHDLDIDQLYWAWEKNRDKAMTLGLTTDEFCPDFKREYPATDDEAFEQAGDDFARVFPLAWVRAAQQRWRDNQGEQVKPMTGLGIDVAGSGPDENMMAPWHHTRLEPFIPVPKHVASDGAELAGVVITKVRDGANIEIDCTGAWGNDLHTHLKKHANQPAHAFVASSKTTKRTRDGTLAFKNERALIHWEFREALNPLNGENVEIPPDPLFEEELLAMTFEVTPGGIQIVSKDIVREQLGRSPDRLDSALLGWRAAGRQASELARKIQGHRSTRPTVHGPSATAIGRQSRR